MADFAAESLAEAFFTPLVQASTSFVVTANAEYLALEVVQPTIYFRMLGFDAFANPTVWQVTGAPDTTNAFSGNPAIILATIRVLDEWTA